MLIEPLIDSAGLCPIVWLGNVEELRIEEIIWMAPGLANGVPKTNLKSAILVRVRTSRRPTVSATEILVRRNRCAISILDVIDLPAFEAL